MMEQTEIKTRPRRQSPARKNRKQQGTYLAILLVAVILLLDLFHVLAPDREYSEAENRTLAQKPVFSADALADGSYFSDLTDYLADQFPGRDRWMAIHSAYRKLLGSKESGDVYLCADDYLIQKPGEPNEGQLQRNLQAMNDFAAAHPQLNMVAAIVPNAATIHADKLPANAPVRDQQADLDRIQKALSKLFFVDVTGTLTEHKDEQLFYRTDHHWTSLGAAYAFEAIAPALDIRAPALSTYTRYTASTTFSGTLSAKTGIRDLADEVELFVPATEVIYFVKYPDGEEVRTLYRKAALDTKDHYTVFFGGNYPRVDITTTAETGKNLLVFKDSYANCFLQFLYPYYEHITMVDPRYYYDSVETILSGEAITDVLYLYNLDTFLSDTSLADTIALTQTPEPAEESESPDTAASSS